ncbi:MAG TPA: ATP-binding protein [Caldimonas sp.]|jgi:two-component system sensor histidine kinase KdpD|nr:ATP-binding protein [Caldimonas sp.]
MANALTPAERASVRRDVVGVVVAVAAATAVSAVLEGVVSLTSQAMVYLFAVVAASYALDRVGAIASAVGAVTAFNFFFVPPRFTLEVEHRDNLIALAAMLAVALLVSTLSAALKRETAAARASDTRSRQLRELAAALLAAEGEHDVLRIGSGALAHAFAGPVHLVAAREGVVGDHTGIADDVARGLQCCVGEAAVLGPGTGRWPGLDAWYVPLGPRGNVVGAACVKPAVAADAVGREQAEAIAALVAQAIARLRLAAANLETRAALQRQHLQSTFLASVSHDLRTPLTAIVAAASSLQQQRSRLSAAEQERLLAAIVAEASHLSAVTENTLQLVRLAAGGEAMRLEWQSVEEIVGSVVARLRARPDGERIGVRIAPGLPLVRGDATLLGQLVANLLDNALKYSDGPVRLVACRLGKRLLVSVKDRGSGVREGEAERVFEPFYRGGGRTAATRGAGLGLALCKAIADVHGGSLAVGARPRGGSRFTLALPIEAQPEAALVA